MQSAGAAVHTERYICFAHALGAGARLSHAGIQMVPMAGQWTCCHKAQQQPPH